MSCQTVRGSWSVLSRFAAACVVPAGAPAIGSPSVSYVQVEVSYARVELLYPVKRPSLKSKPCFTMNDAFV